MPQRWIWVAREDGKPPLFVKLPEMFVTFCHIGLLPLATVISRWKYSPFRFAAPLLTVTPLVAKAAPMMFS